MFQLVSYVAVYTQLPINNYYNRSSWANAVDLVCIQRSTHSEIIQLSMQCYVHIIAIADNICNSNALAFLIIQLPMFLNQVHTLFHKITFVWEVSMCFCVYSPLRVLITSGMIWIPYDWLNKKFQSFCMAFVVDVLMRCGFRSKVHHRNQPNQDERQ